MDIWVVESKEFKYNGFRGGGGFELKGDGWEMVERDGRGGGGDSGDVGGDGVVVENR